MHAVNPCTVQSLVASPGPDPGRVSASATSFGALLTARARGPSPPSPDPPGDSGPLRGTTEPVVPQQLVDVISRLRRDERTLDRHLRRALAGHDMDMPQLVALQSLAFRYSQRVELLGKLVDRLTGAVKQTLQMQV